jgi:hypothetical protein
MMRLKPEKAALPMARALASVPPLTKVTEPGTTPTRDASWARAVSTRSRAARPLACTDDGFPAVSKARSTASRASGRIGAVAL